MMENMNIMNKDIKEGMFIRDSSAIHNVLDVLIDANNSHLNRVYTEFASIFLDDIEACDDKIINLIRKDDYVNDDRVVVVEEHETKDNQVYVIDTSGQLREILEEDIESVETKEQHDLEKFIPLRL